MASVTPLTTASLTSEQAQLAFDLPVRQQSSRRDFLVSESNRRAFDWLQRWPDWPSHLAVISGPEGGGKTHLARIWADETGAEWLTVPAPADAEEQADLLQDCRACVIDNAERFGDETLLFHLCNAVWAARGHMLLTTRWPLARWRLRLADLHSRLSAAQWLTIDPPDDLVLRAILAKQFADRQIRVSPELIDYLVVRMERSFAAARSIVAALDQASLRLARPVSIPLARTVLGETVQ
ncbi:MAG: DNA replication protein [Geminicoccaceae bacterium]